ncbi:MAG TPA: hypothetical protein PLE12_03570, partial [Propionicimonas sp.]|nr:hypothetical protein [Propionicimonas sp.]
SGSFSYGATAVTISGVTVFLGQGPGFAADGTTRNPLAKGLYITGARGQAITAGGSNAFAMSGTVELVGFSGVTLAGTVQVLYNAGTGAVTLNTTPTDAAHPNLAPTNVTVAGGTTAVVGDLTVIIGGQSLTGSIGFAKTATGLVVAFGASARAGGSPLTLSLGGGLATVTAAAGEFVLSPSGTALAVEGTLAFNADNSIDLDGAVSLQLNTSASTLTAGGVALAPRSVRVQIGTAATPAELTVAGQTVAGVFVLSQVTGTVMPGAPAATKPPVSVQLVATDVRLTLGTATAGVRVTDGTAFLALTSAGVAGRISGTVALVVPGDAVSFSGTLGVALNSTGIRVSQSLSLDGGVQQLDLPAGPYLRVEGTGIQLAIAGQRVSGDVTFTRTTDGAGTALVVTVANLQAGFGDGTTDVVRLSNGTGTLTLDAGGLAGNIAGTVSLAVTGFGLSAGLSLQLDTTPAPGASALRLQASGLTVSVGGFSLVGDVSVEQVAEATGRTTRISLDVTAAFGAPIGDVHLLGSLALTPSGLVGDLAVDGLALSIGDDFALAADELRFVVDTAAGTVGLTGTGLRLTLGGPVLSGSFLFSRATSSLGGSRTVIAVSGADFRLSDLAAPVLTGVNGVFVVTATGIAGTLAGTVDLSSLLPPMVGVGGSFALVVNSSSARIIESVTLGESTTSLDVRAGPYLRLAGTGITLTVLGQTLRGDLAIEQAAGTTTLAFSDVSLRLGDGSSDLVLLSGGTGSFTTSATGLGGQLQVSVALTLPGVTLTGAVSLAVDTATNSFRIGGQDLSLTVGGQTIAGTFWISQSGPAGARVTTVAATGVTLTLGEARGVRLTDGTGTLLLTRAGLAASISGTFALVGLADTGLEIGALGVALEINTTAAAVRSNGLDLPAGSFLRLQLGTADAPVSIAIAGQRLGGVFSFEKLTTAGADRRFGTADDVSSLKLAASGLELFLGDDGGTADDTGDDIGVRVSGGSALLLITPSGLAGTVSATATISLGAGLGSLSAAVALQLNRMRTTAGGVTRPLAVDETFVVGGTEQRLQLAAGDYLSVTVTGLALAIGGQSFRTDLAFDRRAVLAADGSLPATPSFDLTVGFSNLSLRLTAAGRDVVVVSGGSGTLAVIGARPGLPGGVAGTVSATVTIDVPGVTFGGSFSVAFNGLARTVTVVGTDLAPGIAVAGTGIVLEIGGQRLVGNVGFAKNTASGAISLVVADARLTLGDGATTFATVTASGALLITRTGLAGSLVASLALNETLSKDFSLAATVVLQVNTTAAAVNTELSIGGVAATLAVPAGTLRVQVGLPSDPARITLFGQSLSGVVLFEQTRTAAGTRVVRLGFSDVSLFLGDAGAAGDDSDDVGLRLSNGSGVILVLPTGYAGELTGTVALVNLPVGFSSDLSLQVNTLGVAVNQTVTFSGADGTAATTRTLTLAKGPYLRLAASNLDFTIGGVALHGDLAFDRFGPTGHQVTRLAVAGVSIGSSQDVGGDNPGLSGASGALVVFAARTATGAGTTVTGGVAGVLTGRIAVGGGSFAFGASVGFSINTTGVAVNQTIAVGDTTVAVALAANPRFAFIVQDLDFDFGDILEVRAGQFQIGSDGTFSGTGLELFIGKGPSRLADGTANPDAIGVLITGASIAFVKGTTGFALVATGTFALLGLDGLSVSGTVAFAVNTSGATLTPPVVPGSGTAATPLAAGSYSFRASNLVIAVAGVFSLAGTLSLTRAPNGDLSVVVSPAAVLVKVGDTRVASLLGYGSFTISATTGFRLTTFKVTGFEFFPTTDPLTGSVDNPTVFPTADLVTPLRAAVVQTAVGTITVVFNDPNGVGLNEATITDAAAELQVLVNGTAVALSGAPVKLAATTWQYTLAAPISGNALVTVRFIAGAFADNGGNLTSGEDEYFVVFTPTATQTRPGPVATLASPANGATITVGQLNAQRYLDVTWTSLDGNPIDKATLAVALAPFTLTGSGVADLKRDSDGRPTLVGGAPLLISGRGDDATTVTYRYFFADSDTSNATGLFGTGTVLVSFTGGRVATVAADGTRATNPANQSQSFTIDPSAPGEKTTNGSFSLGPLTLQNPAVGLADFGFADGMVVLSISLSVNRASLAFGRGAATNTTGTTTAQTGSGITVDLIGVQGTFGLAVDVFGLLSGKVRVEPTGAWSLQVASLTAEIPNVAQLTAGGVVIGYDPDAAAGQELLRINTATITLPRFGVTGRLRPYNPATRSNIDANNDATLAAGLVPGLVVRDNGFSLGTAELVYRSPSSTLPAGATGDQLSTTGGGKLSFGGILVLDDLRVGISGLSVTFGAGGASADFTGSLYLATGGATLFPGKTFSASLTDSRTADDKRSDGTPDDEAFRIALHFTDGVVDAFQLDVDTLQVVLGSYVTLTARDFQLDTGAAGTDAEMVHFGAVGAAVTIGSLSIGGEGRNFGFTGNGDLITHTGFGVFLSVGSATGDSFQWPTWLPIRIDALGIQWDDIENAPADFVLTLSASVTGLQGLAGMTFSGAVQGVKIRPSLLAEGEFPIIAIESFG